MPRTAATSAFTCTVEVDLPPIPTVLARLSFLGHFLGHHGDEEAEGIAADIIRIKASDLGRPLTLARAPRALE